LSVNVAVPPSGTGLTFAVYVTGSPVNTGLGGPDSVVVVGSGFTTWVTDPDVLPVKLESPLYWAVMLWDPPDKVEVVRVA
jgi:hypothetical protein